MAEEIILTGEDLMTGVPSPIVPKEFGKSVLHGIETCGNDLRIMFKCLHDNDVEPFCQDQIIAYRKCSLKRDEILRKRILEEEKRYCQEIGVDDAKSRQADLKHNLELLQRKMILASATDGVVGFQERWKLNGEMQDLQKRIHTIEEVVKSQPKQEPKKKWLFF